MLNVVLPFLKLFLMYHDKSSTRSPLRTRVIKGSAPRVETRAQAGTLDKEHFKQKYDVWCWYAISAIYARGRRKQPESSSQLFRPGWKARACRRFPRQPVATCRSRLRRQSRTFQWAVRPPPCLRNTDNIITEAVLQMSNLDLLWLCCFWRFCQFLYVSVYNLRAAWNQPVPHSMAPWHLRSFQWSVPSDARWRTPEAGERRPRRRCNMNCHQKSLHALHIHGKATKI